MSEAETPEARVKRLHMRSMRRGIREMDIILSAFAEANLSQMDEAQIVLYDALLSENDQDLYQWVTGQTSAPARFSDLIDQIASTLHRN